MKRIGVTFLVIALMALGIAAGVFLVGNEQEFREKAAPSPTTFISLTSVGPTIKTGDTFTVMAEIDNGNNVIDYIELHLSYDETKVEAISATKGSFLANARYIGPSIDNKNGIISYTISDANDGNPHNGIGTLATFTFRAKAAGNTTISFNSSTSAFGMKGSGGNIISGTTPLILTINQ